MVKQISKFISDSIGPIHRTRGNCGVIISILCEQLQNAITMNQIISKVLKKSLVILTWFLATITVSIMTICWLDNLDFFASNSAFFGFDYLPPIWLIVLITPIALSFWFIGNKKLSMVISVFYVIFLMNCGDFSFNFSKTQNYQGPRNVKKVSVAALNVRYYSYGFDQIIEAIKRINADITLLSENVLTDTRLKTLRQRMYPLKFYMGRQEGTAILSRFPVIEFKEILLPSHQASLSRHNDLAVQHLNPHRSFVHAIIEIDGVRLNVISIRFIAGRAKNNLVSERLRWRRYLLKTQLEELKVFKRYLAKLKGPLIFGGDLNAPASSKIMRELANIATDAYMENHLWGEFTFRTNFPALRLDYLFCSHRVIAINSQKLDIIVSDHFPIYAEFLIPCDNDFVVIAAQPF